MVEVAVFRIRDVLIRIRIRWLTDPDLALDRALLPSAFFKMLKKVYC